MKIISLAPSNTDIIEALGKENCLEAVSGLNEDRDIETAGGWVSGPNMDVIHEIDPDVILTSDRLQREIRDHLRGKGYNVEHFEPESLQGVYQSIRDIGELLGSEEEAKKLVDGMKFNFANIDLQGARIYCEEWSNPPMVSGNWVPDLIRDIGGQYFIQEGRSRQIKMKDLKKFDPQHIFLNICGKQETPVKEVENRKEIQDTEAVKNGRIYSIDDSYLNRPSPKLVEGAKKIQELVNSA